jgi:biopolymer transport protein ExbB
LTFLTICCVLLGPGGLSTGAQDIPKAGVAPRTAKVKAQASAKMPGAAPAARGASGVNRRSILALFTRANPMIWLLAICSVVAVGFSLERFVALRRERVVPRDFVNRFLERLASGKLDRDRAAELCRANESPVARVFALIVNYWGQPAVIIRQAIGYDAAGEVSDLKRNVRVLNGTATLAPLLGLLGTVIGMIQSFDALGGKVGPSKGETLAQGISLALVSTAIGLAIAVVSVTAYYYLLNRVDLLVRVLDDEARKVIDLVSSEAIRSSTTDRRTTPGSMPDLSRQESRIH